MVIEEIEQTMDFVEKITATLGYPITKNDYYIEDMGCPHAQPRLPKGYAAVYIFVYESDCDYSKTCEFLKIGLVNEKSNARFTSQHYGFNAPSTLAKSICSDKAFIALGINNSNVKEWILNHLQRINIYIKSDCGKESRELVEAILHYKYRPRYEGHR